MNGYYITKLQKSIVLVEFYLGEHCVIILRFDFREFAYVFHLVEKISCQIL